MRRGKNRSPPRLANFFEFGARELPTVISPDEARASLVRQNLRENQWEEDEHASKVTNTEHDYVLQYVEEERKKIEKLQISTRHDQSEKTTKKGFGRGRGDRDLRKPNGLQIQGRGPPRRRDPEPSIFGTIPDTRASDCDVFLKYDFNKRKFDTSKLVIYAIRTKIITHLVNNQVLMIQGFTGCGKTTQVPQFILDDAVANQSSCRIVVTQPRRIAAISVANRVGSERNWGIGGLVGYQVGMDKRVSEDTRLTYMTTGVLLQLLIARKSLSEYTHIIIDEVHERDIDTDLLLLVIKKLMVDTANRTTKVILMSATLNVNKFSTYFPSLDDSTNQEGCVCLSVDLPNQYPVKELYLDNVSGMTGHENFNMEGLEEPKVHQECFECATKIIESLDLSEIEPTTERNEDINYGAVLVFLPGLLEIETFYKILNDVYATRLSSNSSSGKSTFTKWLVLPLHSSITNEEQQRAFVPARPGHRKIILATNIAESSITVPDIKYDFCLTKSLSCDSTTNYTCLRLEWASKNQCVQRRGRCGRVSAGTVYRMVTRRFYDMLEQEARPEMMRCSLESVVLQVKLLDMGPPLSVLALAVDPPAMTNIVKAVANLKEIGALTINVSNKYDELDGDLTFMGRVISRLPIDIRLGRLILLGHAFDCLEEVVIIAAGLSVKTPFAYPYSRRLEAYLAKMTWATNSFSDCIALLHLYRSWFLRHQRRDFQGYMDEKGWARTYYVQVASLREMKNLIEELYKRLRMCGIEFSPSPQTGQRQLLILKLVIAGAFYPNFFVRTRPNPKEYLKDISKDVVGEDPFTSVLLQGFPLEQPGELYKKVIGNAVAYQNCIPNVEFHGAKVVVTFDSRGDKLGPICSAVYRAIKLRQLRLHVTFPTPRDEAYAMLNTGKRKLATVEILTSPRQIPMPSLKTQKIQAMITFILNPSEFFIVSKNDEMTARQISADLAGMRMSLVPIRPEVCEPGQLCVVQMRGNYFRGRIDCCRNNQEVMVFLIDRGISMWLKRNFVFGISQEVYSSGLHLKPALAIQCRLQGIRPAMKSGSIWCPEALACFENYCAQNDNQVCIQVYSVADCVISAVLKNSDSEAIVPINNLLVQEKLAERCDEPIASEENHNVREKVQSDPNAASAFRTSEEQQNRNKVPVRLMDPPRFNKEPEQIVTLRGPHSPLEMSFSSLCRSAHLKQAMVDGSSINCVALDQEPFNSSARLLIAANVAVSARSLNILARETTLMPPIPGLCGLLAMLFCPKLELRVDESGSIYTGCVTGLGFDPLNGCSIYMDHDMEIVFDTVMDNQDINLINSIRSSMNAVLSDNVNYREIRNLRDCMRTEALKLLERERKSMAEVWPDEPHQWNIIKSERLKGVNAERDSTAAFPLHAHVSLQKRSAESEPSVNRNIYFTYSEPVAQK